MSGLPSHDLSAENLGFDRIHTSHSLSSLQDSPQFLDRNVAQLHAANSERCREAVV